MRSTFLHFALPDLDGTELEQVKEVLDSGWLTTGRKVKQFEAEFAERVGAKHAIAVNSATAAMHLALEAIGLREGDEVITTPYTFAATAEVVRYFNARPVFVDIDPVTLNINPELIEAAIGPRTRAILPVHIAGLPCEMDAINEVAGKHNLVVIEDAAHAFPCVYKGRSIGSISHFTCFSFYATKTITTGEGGMITTDRDDWAERCRIMSLHGISKDAWRRYEVGGSWYYEILAPGYKYNLTDLAAALGLAQLAKAERMAERRRLIAERYNRAFGQLAELQTPSSGESSTHAWHLYPLRLNADRLGIDRSEFIKQLEQRKIGTSVHFIPLHLHPYYRNMYGFAPTDFPEALREYERAISLPIYSRMSNDDIEDVMDAVLDIVRRYGAAS